MFIRIRFIILVISLIVASAFSPHQVRVSAAERNAGDTIANHLDAITESDYALAESYFSRSFRAAILPKVKFVNSYLLNTNALIRAGDYSVDEPVILEKPEFARVRADFSEARIFYYLIHESGGWRIEAFSDGLFDSMADARRPLYLFTNRDWNDTASMELKCRASLYRIQRELEIYRDEKGDGFYPDRLRGGTGRDALTIWEYFDIEEGYPLNYFTARPMKAVHFDKAKSGEFTYIPVDADDDGNIEGYFLVGWGEIDSQHAVFAGTRIIALLGAVDERDRGAVMRDFMDFAARTFRVELTPILNDAPGDA